MLKILNVKTLTLAPSTALTVCFIEPSIALIIRSIKYNQAKLLEWMPPTIDLNISMLRTILENMSSLFSSLITQIFLGRGF